MNLFESILLIFLLISIAIGGFVLWQVAPIGGEINKLSVTAVPEIQDFPLSKAEQFYPRMRYPSREISYTISLDCDSKKRNDAIKAFEIISSQTILQFFESQNGQIRISCSDISPEPAQKNHFVAGEGGPTSIINTTRYSVILGGKIALYRPESCNEPKVAIHEILHALGFDHSESKNSIMYPVTDCKQILDSSIIEEIDKLYAEPPLPDLFISEINANITKIYLDFEIEITNNGLIDAEDVKLEIIADGKNVKSFDLTEIEIGVRKSLSVQNLKVPFGTKEIVFNVGSNLEEELSLTNNQAILSVGQKDNL